jgi:hypothetical protein
VSGLFLTPFLCLFFFIPGEAASALRNSAKDSDVSGLFVSFRQGCLKGISELATVVVFLFGEDNHGWAEAWRYSDVAGAWARSI